jgi:hypothetical protein
VYLSHFIYHGTAKPSPFLQDVLYVLLIVMEELLPITFCRSRLRLITTGQLGQNALDQVKLF